jgi:hypothetical protein
MAAAQLDTDKGGLPGYVMARQATASILKRMMSTSALTPPVELIAEAGWDLPDKQIILAKLRLMDRLLEREHNHRTTDKEAAKEGLRRDGPSGVLRQRIRDVQDGDSRGLCAEVCRIWTEAGMNHKWPPPMQDSGEYATSTHDMESAATRISHNRLISAINLRSTTHPDLPFNELWDGSIWRLTNGTRRQVGLMTSARLGSLVMNDSKPLAQSGATPECPCCGSGYDNLQHALLFCEHQAMKEAQNNLERTLDTLLSRIQKEELRSYSDHETKMFLLGKQMKHKLHLAQQRELDLSVKLQLEAIDDFRTLELELNPMCGRTYTRPPEESMQQAALWDRMWRQQQGRTEGDTSSDQTLQEPWEYDDSTGE